MSPFQWIELTGIGWNHWFGATIMDCLLLTPHHWNYNASILYSGSSKKWCVAIGLDFGFVFSMNWHCSSKQSLTISGQSHHLALPSSSPTPPPLQFYLYAPPSKNYLTNQLHFESVPWPHQFSLLIFISDPSTCCSWSYWTPNSDPVNANIPNPGF